MFGLFLLICVVAVGGLMFAVMLRGAMRKSLARRDDRQRAALYAARVAEAQRVAAERRAAQPAIVPAPAPAPMLVPTPPGEITGVIDLLERSGSFARLATPAPAPLRRIPRGSTAPPIQTRAMPPPLPARAVVAPPPLPSVRRPSARRS